jgi:hypothetical protein
MLSALEVPDDTEDHSDNYNEGSDGKGPGWGESY